MHTRRLTAALLAAWAIGSAGCAALGSMRGSSRDLRAAQRSSAREAPLGEARMLFDDFGTLDTYALNTVAAPWKLYSSALLLSAAPELHLPVERSSLKPVLEHYGFVFPDSIGNWDPALGPQPRFADAPVGSTRGLIHGLVPGLGLEVRNTGCATCHSALVPDATGMPGHVAWLGLPSGSIDLEAYSSAIYAGLKLGMRDEKALYATMCRLYPEMSWGERFTYRHFILPRLRRELPRIVSARDRALSFHNGGPGLTNGVAALKLQLGLISRLDYAPLEMAFTSIPDLADRSFRSSVLCDGTYTLHGDERFHAVTRDQATPQQEARLADIIAFFTLGTSGNDPATAERMIPRMREVLRWLATYRPPPFPGPVDTVLAARGRDVFARHCSGCHGRYDEGLDRPRLIEYPNRLVPQAIIETDSVRWTAVDDRVLAWQRSNPHHPFVRHIDAARTGGYVAPILTGVWATAPYLHNGSVPTLWHLLHPAERPARFEVGGHRLDYTRMGIALEPSADGLWRYPAGYTPWSESEIYDTSQRGRSNRGHERPLRGLTEDDKTAVLEYLKCL